MVLVLFKDRPLSAPSASSADGEVQRAEDLPWNVRQLTADANFVKLALAFGLIFALVNTLVILLGIMANEFEYTDA